MKLFQTLTGAVGADEKGLQGDTLGLAVADAAAADEDVSSRRLMASPRSSRRVADVAAAHHRKHRIPPSQAPGRCIAPHHRRGATRRARGPAA